MGQWSDRYGIGTVGWGLLLRYERLSSAIVLFTAVNLICVVLLGWIGFSEPMGPKRWVGVGMALLSIWLIES